MKTPVFALAGFLLAVLLSSKAYAQAFVNDNDGLLDVGEAPGFPADPMAFTGSLNLSYRRIEDLDGATLLTTLQALDLWGNRIISIESGDFNGLAELERLYLGSNQIARIESGAFHGLTRLQWLRLPLNFVANIESSSFSDLSDLQVLDLVDNYITSIDSGVFDGLTNLQALWLNNNRITNIDSRSLEQLTNLQILFLHNNQISTIDREDFAGLTSLERLTLANNRISTIDRDSFAELTNLQILFLVNNQITRIEHGTFKGLTNLQSLGLSFNNITSIKSGDFDGLDHLASLDLSNNSISEIEPGVFAGKNHVSTLYLHGNKFSELDFSGATFDQLSGFLVDSDEILKLVLDQAALSRSSFSAILTKTTSIVDVSLVDLAFTNGDPSDLGPLLGIATLDNVRIDPYLYNQYQDEFDVFAASEGNTVTIVPEPASCSLLLLGAVAWLRNRGRRVGQVIDADILRLLHLRAMRPSALAKSSVPLPCQSFAA